MKKVTVYTLNYCPYCKKAKNILRDRNLQFEEIDVTSDEDAKTKEIKEKYKITGMVTFPQIIVGENRIGGCSDLEQLVERNQIDELLKED